MGDDRPYKVVDFVTNRKCVCRFSDENIYRTPSIHAKFADISLELDCDLEAPKSEDFRLIVHVSRPTATMTEARGLAYVEEA